MTIADSIPLAPAVKRLHVFICLANGLKPHSPKTLITLFPFYFTVLVSICVLAMMFL